MAVYVYGGKEFISPILSADGGCRLQPQPSFRLTGPTVDAVTKEWNYNAFETAWEPIKTPVVVDSSPFLAEKNIRILDMPIKMKGSVDDYRLPAEVVCFKDTIQEIINMEHATFPPEVVKEYYAYLTIDQKMLKPGEMQRNEGAHVDGFQGSRVYPKTAINHTYVVANLTRTRFLTCAFRVSHLNPIFHNFFLEFDRQASLNPGKEMFTEFYRIYMMNAYCVHEATVSEHCGYRTFVRLSYDLKEFDRLGNAHNPMFDYMWKMVPRFTQFALAQYMPLDCAIPSKAFYYNFLYELSLLDRKDITDWLITEIKKTIDTDVVIARLCYTIILRGNCDDSVLKQALAKNKDVLFSDLLAEISPQQTGIRRPKAD